MPLSPSNVTVAEKLGVSPAAVCRFRKGKRVPRIDTRVTIAETFRWPITTQAVAEANGSWHREFEAVLGRSVR